MPKPIADLEIEVFDWPCRFLVESEEYDRDYYRVWPDAPKEPAPPHLVDLEVEPEGWCDCRDFRFNIEPYLKKKNTENIAFTSWLPVAT